MLVLSLISLNLVEGGKIKNPTVPDREHSRSQSARDAVSASLLPSPGSKFVEDNVLETKVGTKMKQHARKSAAFRLISHLLLPVPSSHTPGFFPQYPRARQQRERWGGWQSPTTVVALSALVARLVNPSGEAGSPVGKPE